jgi:hypothetical protein
LKPDPNHPDDDTFWLHFPHAVEEVENREFWLKHLPELLTEFAEAFRDKSEAELRAKLAEQEREMQRLEDAWMQDETIGITNGKNDGTLRPSIRKTLARLEAAEAELAALRERERTRCLILDGSCWRQSLSSQL